MRLVFAGTPAPAVPTLRALVAAGHEIVTVITRPDAPLGRRRVLTPSPVAVVAEELGLPVLKASRLDDDVTAEIASLAPDLGVIVAYGGLVRAALLAVPRAGWINLHFSLLPAWRGAAPVQRALIADDARIGAAVFHLVEALDAGDVFATLEESVDGRTAGEMLEILAGRGADLTVDVVGGIEAGTARAVAQSGPGTVAPKLTAVDGELDPLRPAAELLARFRGTTPEPGAFVRAGEQRVKVLALDAVSYSDPGREALPAAGRVALVAGAALLGTTDGVLRLVSVQPAGKKPMDGASWLRGLGDLESVVLGASTSTASTSMASTSTASASTDGTVR